MSLSGLLQSPGPHHAFLSQIRDWNHGSTPPRLTLELPTRLLATEHRRNFRIPLGADSGLDVRVSIRGGEVRPARPLDISIGGMLIELPDDPDLEDAAKLDLEMRLDDDTVHIGAVVRHRCACRYGLLFADAVGEDRVRPLEPLRRLVDELEQRWLGQERFRV